MGVGEALVSFLDDRGVPGIVERAFILPPQSLMKPADDETVNRMISESIYERLYRETLDRDSAYELLVSKKAADEKAAAEAARVASEQEELEKRIKELEKQKAAAEKQRQKEELAAQKAYERQLAKEEAAREKARERRQKNIEKQANKLLGSALNTIGRELGKSITRGLFGNWK